jgi:hypothetical protein
LHPGDRLIVTVDAEGGFRVVSAREQAQRLREPGLFGGLLDVAPIDVLMRTMASSSRDCEQSPGLRHSPSATAPAWPRVFASHGR